MPTARYPLRNGSRHVATPDSGSVPRCRRCAKMPKRPRTANCAAAKAVWHATEPNASEAAGRVGFQSANAARRAPAADFSRTFAHACLFHTVLIRDNFGNPFQPVAFSSEWRSDTAVSLAKQMYEAREFSAMPIL